jgi:hypothetical protein
MSSRSCLAYLLLPLMLVAPVQGQRDHDPLNNQEVEQLRDTALEPEKRLKLFVEFARARLDSIQQVQDNPKITDPGQEIHNRLQSFLDIYDELNDNVDNFSDRNDDLRKALPVVIGADTEFAAKLRALRDAAKIKPTERKEYDFLLGTAIESVDGSAQDHRQLLAEQEEAAKHKKKEKH